MAARKRFSASYHKSYPQTRQAVGEARRGIVEFARSCGFTGQCLEDIELAVGEALANAVEHGYAERGSFEVDVRCDAYVAIIEVVDSGRGFDHGNPVRQARPPGEASRGFGTFIMHELMDEVEYSQRGTRLRLVKHLPAAPEERSTLRWQSGH